MIIKHATYVFSQTYALVFDPYSVNIHQDDYTIQAEYSDENLTHAREIFKHDGKLVTDSLIEFELDHFRLVLSHVPASVKELYRRNQNQSVKP